MDGGVACFFHDITVVKAVAIGVKGERPIFHNNGLARCVPD